MLVVACGSAAVLAWVYAITREPIKKAGEAKELEAVAEVIYGGFDNDPFQEKHISTRLTAKNVWFCFPPDATEPSAALRSKPRPIKASAAKWN